MECPECGGFVRDGASYCRHCGQKVEKSSRCKKCAQLTLDGAKYCHRCGTNISADLTCHECGNTLPSDSVYCAFCGADVTATEVESRSSLLNQPMEPAKKGSENLTEDGLQVTYIEDLLNSAALAQEKMPPNLKNPRTAALLAGLVGAIAIMGVGHFYIRRFRRGAAILLTDLLLLVLVLASLADSGELLIFLCLFLLGMILWVWQIADAYKLTNQYNEEVKRHGRAPW